MSSNPASAQMSFGERFVEYFSDISQAVIREYSSDYIDTKVYDHVKLFKTEEFPFTLDILVCNLVYQLIRIDLQKYTNHRVALTISHSSLPDSVFVPYSPSFMNILPSIRRQMTANLDLNQPFRIALSYCSNKMKV